MIKLDSVTKSFGEKKVIQRLTLEVEKNELLALLGPNGCGKTTLLNMLSGLIQPDEGNIYINDVLVSGKVGAKKVCLKPSERKVGYVFQTTSLFPHMRAQDNVAYGLKTLHLAKQEVNKRTNTLLDFVGLREYAKFYPHQLSGGQKQRIALARSLATEPQVLLLDEPVSAVDPQLKESFRLELKNYLQALKITVVYVTHNLTEAFIMSDRIAVMGNGHIEQIGNRTEIFNKPSSKYVAKFLGINAYQGKVVKTRLGLLEVEVNGVPLSAPSVPELVGREVIVTIRPESIMLATRVSKGASVNSVEGVITEMVQMRSTTQVTVDVGFLVKARLLSKAIKDLGFSVGDKVYVCFDAEALNVCASNSGE